MIWFVFIPAAIGSGWLLGEGDAIVNLRALIESGPSAGLLSLLGLTVGLYGRDRIRLGRTYASPTVAYLGKRLFLGALTASSTYTLSPVGWPPECVLPFAAAVACGAALWLGNLPVRL